MRRLKAGGSQSHAEAREACRGACYVCESEKVDHLSVGGSAESVGGDTVKLRRSSDGERRSEEIWSWSDEREEFTEQVKLLVLQLGVRSVTSEMSDACTICESIACAVTCTKTCTDPSRKDRSKVFVNHLCV